VRTLSVVVPTFQRPDWIKRAIGSLARQTRLPDEVIPIMRDTDEPTHRAVAEVAAGAPPFPLRPALVVEPGFLPPVRAGLALATGDVVAVLDDDAEALPSWIEGILRHYDDAAVGAVGGRYINMIGDVEQEVAETDTVGRVTRLGRFVGNMYKRPTFAAPVDVDFMIGGCMSFRREVARRLEFDMALNRNVGYGYEVDLGLQVRGMGWRIRFDPAVQVRHYSAPRQITGLRAPDDESVRWAAYNHARVALRRLPTARGLVALGYMVAIGDRDAPGVLPTGLGPIGRRAGFRVARGGAALRGRLQAIAHVLRDGRGVRTPVTGEA
jgi:glycosyltransferase involved in cell wall biosynthesis